jgi:hypothetical protein
MARRQGPAQAEIDDGRAVVATLGDVLPIGEVFGNGFDGLELGAREDQRVADRRADEKEEREQEDRAANALPNRSTTRLGRLPFRAEGFLVR